MLDYTAAGADLAPIDFRDTDLDYHRTPWVPFVPSDIPDLFNRTLSNGLFMRARYCKSMYTCARPFK